MNKRNQDLQILNANKILLMLKKCYPDAKIGLNFKSPIELLIATILSAQCTDKTVNKVTPMLFKKYSSVSDFAEADLETLENLIHSTGFFRNKAKNIISLSKILIKDYDGNVPQTMESLTSLPGVARKTANIVLLSAFGIISGIAVDTHVRRLSQRLGLTEHSDPVKIENDLMKIIPKKNWDKISYYLIEHGRKICTARKPQCKLCPLIKLCPYADKNIQL